jgi:hypothetical protein
MRLPQRRSEYPPRECVTPVGHSEDLTHRRGASSENGASLIRPLASGDSGDLSEHAAYPRDQTCSRAKTNVVHMITATTAAMPKPVGGVAPATPACAARIPGLPTHRRVARSDDDPASQSHGLPPLRSPQLDHESTATTPHRNRDRPPHARTSTGDDGSHAASGPVWSEAITRSRLRARATTRSSLAASAAGPSAAPTTATAMRSPARGRRVHRRRSLQPTEAEQRARPAQCRREVRQPRSDVRDARDPRRSRQPTGASWPAG